jgi:LacI family transcriptional regulator
LTALDDPPTSIFAANDSLAFRAIEVLRTAGRRIPEDVAVVGFDDIPLAQEMLPPLTTVRIPLAEIGRRAATRVLQRIESGQSDGSQADMIPAELICRGTA